jgi:hypothetical protein
MSLLHRFLATGAPVPPANYIEECFSVWLYQGNGSTQTITNGIDLSGKGGLVWIKSRSATWSNYLQDTVRGIGNELSSDTTAASGNNNYLTSVSATGFSLAAVNGTNQNAATYVSWTFRKQPKFFDVVTYTGNGSNRTISHALGSVPGCIIVKRTDTTADWAVYHNSIANTEYLVLNTTAAKATGATRWNSTTPTASVFSLGTDASVNASGGTYVAYLFAHNAGGFGLTGTDNVISCGSFVSSGGIDTINLGYEPQWVLYKSSSNLSDWRIADTMRGMSVAGNTAILYPNLSSAEQNAAQMANPTATGFQMAAGATISGATYIYIAIRRGPMKVPTLGTSVFAPFARTGSGSTTVDNVGVPADAIFIKNRFDAGYSWRDYDRLRGGYYLAFNNTNPEAVTGSYASLLWSTNQNSVSIGAGWSETNYSGGFFADYVFRRAPGFFDEVCYTGTGSNTTQAHNLGVVPELMIVKNRIASTNWAVYSASIGAANSLWFNTTNGAQAFGSNYWNSTPPTSTVFNLGTDAGVNQSTSGHVAYLFATVAGVSKVGSYTGNGSSQTIACGFTTGARWVLIKRTDSTGNWVVADSARGLVAAADPALYLNSTAAEVTGVDWIDPDNSGFIIIQEATFNLNVNGASYIYLAIA